MKPSLTDLKKELHVRDIRLSHQRLKVLEYLTIVDNHPSAEDIYDALLDELPSLSKATVYNTLHMLQKAALVNEISIENSENRYEIKSDRHGHFQCQLCNNIIDIQINEEMLLSPDLEQFVINKEEVYFRGICPNCQTKMKIFEENKQEET